MSEELRLDERARKKIAEDIFENFFVEAGAGSGKTTSLVTRMVNMVKKGITVDKISAITYTKAAANEFYERFQKELAKEKDELCIKALKDIDLAFMGTIDAFCNMVISEHPSFIGVPSDVTNRSREEMETIYRNEFSRIRAGEYGEGLRHLCQRYIDLQYRPEDSFVTILSTLMDKRDGDFVYEEISEEEIDEVLDKELKMTFEVLKEVAKRPELILEEGDKPKKAKEEFLKKADILNKPVRNIPSVMAFLNSIIEMRLSPDTVLSSLGPNSSKVFRELILRKKFAGYEIDKENFVYEKLVRIQFSVTMRFISKAIPLLAERSKRKGDLVFFDYILYLRDALREDARNGGALIRHINERHSYFLIDEFQDTNPIQIEIFFYLTAKEIHPDIRRCIPQKGSLFIVGDPKQSIYRFSGADVSSFLKIRELFENREVGEVLSLTQNFRSEISLCEWYNKAFSSILTESEDQAAYTEIPLENKSETSDTFSGVYKYSAIGGNRKNPVAQKDSDPYKVKEIILRIMNDDEFLISEKIDGEIIKRRPRYKDFMLISPNKTHLRSYMKVLRECHIPFKIEGQTLFDDCPAFILISKIYGAIAYPKDNIRVFEALRSDYFNMSEKDIYDSCAEKGYELDLTLDQDLKELKELRELLVKAKTMSLSGLYRYIMDRYEVFKHADTLNMEYVYYGLELLKDKEMNNELSSREEAYDYLKSLLERQADVERCMSLSRDEDKVHLANAHKVKGLEAPIVILIDGKNKAPSPSLRVERDPASCYVFNIKKDGMILVLKSSGYEDRQEAEKLAESAERDRLLYVAATRARNVLIVNEMLNPSGKLASSTWSKCLEYISKDIFEVLKDEVVTITSPEITFIEYLSDDQILDKSASMDPSYEIARPSKEIKHKYDEDYLPSGRKDAALIGTLAHRLMEVLVISGDRMDLEDAVDGIIDEYCEDETYRELLLKLGKAVRNGGFKQENEVSRDILNELLNAEEVYCEVPFSYMEGNELWNGIIDVLYEKDGQWYIIDYKTNTDPDDLDARYKEQLAAYKKAFKQATGLDAKALIYHLEV